MELSKRLQAVADQISEGSTVADVGCDHGYVSIYLIREGIAKKVLAMDVKEGPLSRASLNIQAERLTNYIETRLSDGLLAVGEKEVDSVICAGMGGRLTVKILTDGAAVVKNVKELVLQPQSELHLVRNYLYEIGFQIIKEVMVLDEGKYYQIIKAVPATGEMPAPLTQIEAQYGPCLLKERNLVLKEFLLLEKAKYEQIISNLKEKRRYVEEPINKLSIINQALKGYTNEM